ncbi:CAP domain-containing protein [Streptomyces sp. NPDC060031]|uniref:CAP domain-containing protein n=1 Tax=Streptomyces sp. NPDC060031 TaxID=3347043 RepID=UPI0036A273E6
MQKHRKKKPFKKIAIAVGALGIAAVPTAAMACWDTQDTGSTRTASRHENRPWQGSPSATASSPAPVTPVTPVTPVDVQPPSSPPAAAPSSPEASAQPVVRTSPPPQPVRPPVVTEKPQAPAPPKPSAPPASGAAAAVLSLVNQERSAAGCSALTLNEKLTKAAQDHSEDMAAHGNMSHTGSDGSDPGGRITRAGYAWGTYGENVAYGYGTPEKVMEGWMNSPGHRENILNCSFKEIGIGLAQPNHYWTQDFGATR